MKPIPRSAPPAKLANDQHKAGYYNKLRDEKGKIRPRWNTIRERGAAIVRDALGAMSDHCCCFCGRKVVESDMDVDHFLPSSFAPYLSYCWENLIPTCKRCNQAFKNDYYPPALQDKVIVEACMAAAMQHDHVYDKHTIMTLAGTERILDPTYDTIEDHLAFQPEFYSYQERSPIGTKTNQMFFDREEVVRDLAGISDIVRELVKSGCTQDVMDPIISTYGQDFYYRAFYEYWLQEQQAGRMR